jgi:hypothetical protein
VTYWSIVVAAIAIVKSYKVCVKEGVTKPTATFSFFSYFYFQWISGRSNVPLVVVVVVLGQRDTAWTSGHDTHSSSTTVYDVSAIFRFLLNGRIRRNKKDEKRASSCVCVLGDSPVGNWLTKTHAMFTQSIGETLERVAERTGGRCRQGKWVEGKKSRSL